MESKGSHLGPLPLEIHFSILDILIQEYRDAGPDSYKYAAGVVSLLLVCKAWHSYGSRQIYKVLYFGRPFQYFKLAKHLQSENGARIRKLVKGVILDLYEKQGCAEVVESYVIQTIFKLCRRIRTVDLRCKWATMPQNTVWNYRIAKAMKVYANPVRFLFNDAESAPFVYIQGLLDMDIFTFMKNLQRLDLYVEPNSKTLARTLAQLSVSHMTVRVFLQMDDDGDIDYTPENELTTLDADAHIVRPHTFFQIVATNEHLRNLEILSRRHYLTPRTAASESEAAIEKWINTMENGAIMVTMRREYPPPHKQFVFSDTMGRHPERGPPKKWLDEMKENYELLDDHESDEDPSDSEWEQDTHLSIKYSNRELLISPTVSQIGDD